MMPLEVTLVSRLCSKPEVHVAAHGPIAAGDRFDVSGLASHLKP